MRLGLETMRAVRHMAAISNAPRRPVKRAGAAYSSPRRFAIERFTGGNALTAHMAARDNISDAKLSLTVWCIAFSELRTARNP
jgi:hypothetical protein